MIMEMLAKRFVNISTIEDPVERALAKINQTQINPLAGLTFDTGLRSILRQDPDIIMIGEIRDEETVEIAIRAAITGHLVLSTIHTNDAVSTVYRLVDMGVPAFMVAASIVGIISQRLMRLICPGCRIVYHPSEAEFALAGFAETDSGRGLTFNKGSGCSTCHQTGYKGRIAVHEILIATHEFRDLIHNGASVGELRRYAVASGMVPLRESAFELLRQGRTTIEEFIAITHGT
jgi:type IV pilus assembly protein PilB